MNSISISISCLLIASYVRLVLVKQFELDSSPLLGQIA